MFKTMLAAVALLMTAVCPIVEGRVSLPTNTTRDNCYVFGADAGVRYTITEKGQVITDCVATDGTTITFKAWHSGTLTVTGGAECEVMPG